MKYAILVALLVLSMSLYVNAAEMHVTVSNCNDLGLFSCIKNDRATTVSELLMNSFRNGAGSRLPEYQYMPAVCKHISDPLQSIFIDFSQYQPAFVWEKKGFYFQTSEECISYCIDKHGSRCEYSPEYTVPQIGACVADDGKVSCSQSGSTSDCSDAVGCEGKECMTVGINQCWENFTEQPVPEQTFEQPVLPIKNITEVSFCPICVGNGATWCENVADPRTGYCAYQTQCMEGFYERSGSVGACDEACTTSRDGVEPAGECVNILRMSTQMRGGYFVSGFCQSSRNAAYQCFIHDEAIRGCQSCIESINSTAIWCRTGSADYCAYNSECIGDAVDDVTMCDDYNANAPEVEDGGIYEYGGAQSDFSDIQTTNPDLWQSFMNWLGWRG